jgi:hypothetical protein
MCAVCRNRDKSYLRAVGETSAERLAQENHVGDFIESVWVQIGSEILVDTARPKLCIVAQ